LLTLIEQRLALLQKLGVEATLVLSFTEELCRLTPRQYVKNILIDSVGASLISVGYNHHFGRDREGNPALLAELGASLGFSVKVSSPVYVDGIEVSSSKIREAIVDGQIELANQLLDRPYAIIGEVIPGASRGKAIGFPTANLLTDVFQVVPRQGVYAGLAKLNVNEPLPAVINIGTRPTFESAQATAMAKPEAPSSTNPLVEVHILDFDENIYSQKLELSFCKYLRSERRFESISALKNQILADCEQSKAYFHSPDRNTKARITQPKRRQPA